MKTSPARSQDGDQSVPATDKSSLVYKSTGRPHCWTMALTDSILLNPLSPLTKHLTHLLEKNIPGFLVCRKMDAKEQQMAKNIRLEKEDFAFSRCCSVENKLNYFSNMSGQVLVKLIQSFTLSHQVTAQTQDCVPSNHVILDLTQKIRRTWRNIHAIKIYSHCLSTPQLYLCLCHAMFNYVTSEENPLPLSNLHLRKKQNSILYRST